MVGKRYQLHLVDVGNMVAEDETRDRTLVAEVEQDIEHYLETVVDLRSRTKSRSVYGRDAML